MLLIIDHIVIVVRDLAETVTNFEAAGLTVIPGGEHIGGATHNALISFTGGTYFELIAFREPGRPQSHRWWERLTRGEGLVDYALLSDNLTEEASRAEAGALPLRGPVDGGRQRPDGVDLVWRSFFLGNATGETALPFVIQDVTPREWRVPGGAATQHRIGARQVAGLSLLTSDLDAADRQLRALLGAASSPTTGRIPEVGPSRCFQLGSQWLELIQPTDPASPELDRLRRLGAGPYEVVLSASDRAQPGQGELLKGKLNGARIRIAE